MRKLHPEWCDDHMTESTIMDRNIKTEEKQKRERRTEAEAENSEENRENKEAE
ncbi:hypothetical protein PVK06_030094 [Gossypium arboreum]|uniref:Uncharacterized protein n=1 Tax=Gossypium arboreum TaxID=29729 RepID=A0ABR0NMC9_GOSAR|nr:hypothetical protein PVK06_030094 [Gossypium arboreum]